MKKFTIFDDFGYFQCPISYLSDKEQKILSENNIYVETFATEKSSKLQSALSTADPKACDGNLDLFKYQKQVAKYYNILPSVYPTITKIICPIDNMDGYAMQFYLLRNKSGQIDRIVFSFNQEWSDLASIFENEVTRNMAYRTARFLGQCYDNGKDFLLGDAQTLPPAFFIIIGISTYICPFNGTTAESSDIDEKWVENLFNHNNQYNIDKIYLDLLRISNKLQRFNFIYGDKESNVFNSTHMKTFFVEPTDLNENKRDEFLKNGIIETQYSTTMLDFSPEDMPEVNETIQFIEKVNFLDNLADGLCSYDIRWIDNTHTWACKISGKLSTLLEQFDYYELESKIPTITKAYLRGLNGENKGGVIIENSSDDMIFMYDFEPKDNGDINKVHLECCKWAKQAALELIKYQKYLSIKQMRDGKKETDKFTDTISRGAIYQLLGSFLGG